MNLAWEYLRSCSEQNQRIGVTVEKVGWCLSTLLESCITGPEACSASQGRLEALKIWGTSSKTRSFDKTGYASKSVKFCLMALMSPPSQFRRLCLCVLPPPLCTAGLVFRMRNFWSLEQFWATGPGHLGIVLSHFGVIWESSGSHLRVIWESFGSYFGVIQESSANSWPTVQSTVVIK